MWVQLQAKTLVHEKQGAISDILFLKHVYFLVLCVNPILPVCNMTGILCTHKMYIECPETVLVSYMYCT